MPADQNWTRQQLLVAFNLYCRLPFGKLHSRNPDIEKYAKLIGRTPSALAMKLTNIASLDPAITSTGRSGLKGASQADKAMWHEMQSNWKDFAIESYKAIEAVSVEFNSDVELEAQDAQGSDEVPDYTGGSRTAQVRARIGQEFFRKAVLSAYSYKCCITGLAVPELLVASHIIPWSVNAENRLNPRNGLCLSALHDKAFDKGIVTISEECTVRISKRKTVEDDEFYRTAMLAYDGKRISLAEKFQPDPDFLAYHREKIFDQ
jgi:predicted restriction endonuclease